ncbi:hypothetical protein R5R35_006546 [Gryllus longicercus]|uniref:Uncharacterized protein n=1 Tax=Gryllus longicercus TaxID=2509291 RepID=A0AAN9V6P6_9ORTH
MDSPVDVNRQNLLSNINEIDELSVFNDGFEIDEDEQLSGLSDAFELTEIENEEELFELTEIENEEELFEPVTTGPVINGPVTCPRIQDENELQLAIQEFYKNENKRNEELYKYKLFIMKEENRRQNEIHALKMLCIQHDFFQNY